MKKLLLLLIFGIFLVSCASLKEIQSEKISYGIDLSRFSDKSFLITPEKYNGQYLLISIYTLDYFPAAHLITTKGKNGGSDKTSWVVEKINFDELFNEIYDSTLDKKGNAFINFKIEDIQKYYSKIEAPVTITGIRITGWMIKRID